MGVPCVARRVAFFPDDSRYPPTPCQLAPQAARTSGRENQAAGKSGDRGDAKTGRVGGLRGHRETDARNPELAAGAGAHETRAGIPASYAAEQSVKSGA